MSESIFPPVESANTDGLLAIGGDINFATLKEAYLSGIFPWPIGEQYPLTWFSPDPRGVIFFDDLHIPKSLSKSLKKINWTLTYNQQFDQVIQVCSEIRRKHETGTWINQEVLKGYKDLFRQGHAYSVEVWNEQKELIGGLYGVCFGEIISGESMFHREDNASKFALIALIEKLRSKGIKFLDTQMVTEVVRSLGGKEIPRSDFIQLIQKVESKRLRDDLF